MEEASSSLPRESAQSDHIKWHARLFNFQEKYMASDRQESISPPLSDMDPPSPEPNAGEVLIDDEKPPIPISEPAFVAPLDAGPDPTASAHNNGGRRDSPEFTARFEPITLAKRSLVLTAQTAAALIILPVTAFTSAAKILSNLAVVLTIFAYVSCVCAVWQSKNNLWIAGLMGEMSTAFSGASFLLTMGLLLPQKLFWIVVLNCLVLFSVFCFRRLVPDGPVDLPPLTE